MESNEIPYAGPGRVFFKAKIDPNEELAQKVISREFDLSGYTFGYDPDDYKTEEGYHLFFWGNESYSQWQLESSEGWIGVLEPVIEDNELIDYKVVELERVE